jgi:BASS family bile acid:Na+ symporter
MTRLLHTAALIAGQYFAILVIVAAAFGWYAPAGFAWVGPNISLFLGLVMFGVGVTVRRNDFQALLMQPWKVIGGVAAQYLVMPLLALALSLMFGLSTDLTIGLVLLGACPGGIASNLVTFIARGNVALSVAITSVSTLIAPLMTPILTLSLVGTMIDVSTAALFRSIVEIIIVPVALGVLIHAMLGAKVEPIGAAFQLISVLAITLLVGFVVGANHENFRTIPASLIGAVVAHNLLGFGSGYLIARLMRMPAGDRKAICFEVGMQNSGLAITLATIHFGPVVALPAALASPSHAVSGPLVANFWTWTETLRAKGQARSMQ